MKGKQMNAWWYGDKDKPTGPVELNEIMRLRVGGSIGPATLVWREGMATWQPLSEIDELNESMAALPPPLPTSTGVDPLSFSMATRWPRFFARIFDTWWEVLLVAVVASAILGRYSAAFVEWINEPGTGQVFSLLCLPFALVLDALVYRFAGNTPGKALLGLKVGTLKAQPLSFGEYLQRNFSIWMRGFAFGIPLVNLFTMANQSGRLGRGQQASYDEATGFRVRAKPSKWLRKTVFGLAFFGLFMVVAVLNTMEKEADRKAVSSQSAKNSSWENPLTGENAEINSRWKLDQVKNDDGQTVYTFSERNDRAIVVLGMEQGIGYTLQDYVRRFQNATATEMKFSDGGRFVQLNGRPAWKGSGSLVADGSARLQVEVVQYGPVFWRIVTIQAMPHDYSDAMVEELKASLWKTAN